jgi:hypothetical protein
MPPTLEISKAIDFESIVLKKGQRAPKGWKVIIMIASDFPAGWPPGKPHRCQCGCGKTLRIGDRVAIRKVRKTGGDFIRKVR